MKEKNTPGPWANPGNSNIVGADGTLVVSVPRPKGVGATERRNANARLIAAAPELFAAVKDYAENADCGNSGDHTEEGRDQAAHCWHCSAVALVAKVEGRQS